MSYNNTMKKTLKKILIFLKLYNLTLSIHQLITAFILHFHLLKPHRLVVRDDVLFDLDLTKTIDMHIFRDSWEPWIVAALKKLLKQGDVVLEAGANIGAHSLLIGKLIAPDGKLYSFEPTNYAFVRLKNHIKLNNLESVIKSEKFVLSNSPCDMPIKSMVSDFKLFAQDEEIGEDISDCQITSIDDYFLKNKIESLKLMKIDVDGYDFKVLSGSKATIQKFRPIVLIELANFTLHRQGDSVNDIYNLLAGLNYTGFFLSTPTNNNYMWGCKIESAEEILRISGMNSHVDSIFFPIEKLDDLESLIFE
jgi:FkbM family methyltransferase